MACLSNEIVTSIINFLPVSDRLRLRLVCRDFRDLVDYSFRHLSSLDRYRQFSKLTYWTPPCHDGLKWWWTTFFHGPIKEYVFYSISMQAVEKDQPDTLAWILEEAVLRLIPVVQYKEALAQTAVIRGRLSCLQVLVKSGLSDGILSRLLVQAAEVQDMDTVFYLINSHAPIDTVLMQPIAKHQNLEMLKLLFQYVDEARKPDFVTDLSYCKKLCCHGCEEIYKWLWAQGLLTTVCQKQILSCCLQNMEGRLFTEWASHFQYLNPTDLLDMIEHFFSWRLKSNMPALYFIVNHTLPTHKELLTQKLKDFMYKHEHFMTQEDMACISRVYEYASDTRLTS